MEHKFTDEEIEVIHEKEGAMWWLRERERELGIYGIDVHSGYQNDPAVVRYREATDAYDKMFPNGLAED